MREMVYQTKKFLKGLYTYPEMTLKEVDYDAYWKVKRSEKKIGSLSDWQRERADKVLSFIVKNTRKVILADVGCGDGSVLTYIRKNLPEDKIQRLIGYDVSDYALMRAREFGIETHHFDIRNDDVNSLVEADLYLLFEVLEHVQNSEQLLVSAYNKSRKGVFFSLPNTGYLAHRMRLFFFGRFPLQWRLHPSEHIRFWTLRDMRWWLKSQGYTQAEVKTLRGVPLLNRVWPSLFAAGILVYIEK